MLLPITSRLLLEALSPERPCWKPMAFLSLWSRPCGHGRNELVEGLDRAVRHRSRALELEVEGAAGDADRIDAVAHQRCRRSRDAAGGRADPEGQAARAGRAARRPVEAVHARALRAEIQ